MKNPFRKNKEVKENIMTLSPTETVMRGNYVSAIIKKRYYDYYNINHRKAVCQIDAIAKRLTHEWADRVTTKTFKFYSSHEIDGVEVMQDQRKQWVEMNCDEIFNATIVPMVQDGFVLFTLEKDEEAIKYDVYGEFESSPMLWTRIADNKISNYKVQFTPNPRGVGSSGQTTKIIVTSSTSIDNMRAINREYSPEEIIHCEFGKPNWGIGMPLIEGAWDSIIKLAIESHQDMLDRRSIPTLEISEEDVDASNTKVKAMLKMVANSDQDTARVWVHKNNVQGEVSEYPKFSMRSATADNGDGARVQNPGISTGDFGNVSKEWARLTTVTGFSINYFMGNKAGAVVGSETDKASDDEQEIIKFGQLEVVIRKILDWLIANELMTLPTEPFVIKYWKDWEKIEAAALLKKETQEAADKAMLGQPGNVDPIDAQDNKPKENIFKLNEFLGAEIYRAAAENMSFIMTPVVSHWIDKIGYYDVNDKLYMQLLDGKIYSKPSPMGEWSYLDWKEASSMGGYFWDYLSQRDPPWQRASIPAALISVSDMAANTVKVPILDYRIINSVDTRTKMKRLGKEIDWSMGNGTADNIIEMLDTLKKNSNKHQLRYNTMTAEAFGNSIKENYPLLYNIGDGLVVEEFICPESWKKNVGKKVPLGVYHNRDVNNTPELPDWQIVGEAEIFGWDDLDGEDFVRYNYDYDKITSVFKKLNEYDWLTASLNETGTSDISTAYYCDVEYKWNDALNQIIRIQTNIELISISFVPMGNCPGEICSLVEVKRNSEEMQAFIKACMDEGQEKSQCLASAYKQFKGVNN